ncbi:hypothetical protein [Bacillus sp. T33-2]|uniref:hypothetical protein n=1 Tax=Bacillus sp. T33-2 TaxID=2054168 RepID=UPI000C756A47|nr:hypothetical protein [Bacillus sp. T33-2]PLR94839.1 hypothetical protein CVD19_16330 [Bacillus sp. T33-2]
MNKHTENAIKRKRKMAKLVAQIVIANKLLLNQDTESTEIRHALGMSYQNFNFYLRDPFLINELRYYGIQVKKGKYRNYFFIQESELKMKIQFNLKGLNNHEL